MWLTLARWVLTGPLRRFPWLWRAARAYLMRDTYGIR